MHGVVLLMIGLLGAGGAAEYARPLGARSLDQATLDAEGYGEKKAFKREDDGLRITLAPGDQETGWKTPQQVRFGGDFTISAEFVIKKLPKPAMEDGAAVGLAIAFNDINQPDVTLVRLLETNGSDVYRPIEKQGGGPMQMMAQNRMQMRMQMMAMGGMVQPGGKPPKPPRHTFPAAGDVVRMEIQREGSTIRYQVIDKKSTRIRYLGQVELGPMDIAAVKLFASNRNGAEAVNVLLRELTVHADRISGLGTLVRTVFDEVIYNEPTALDNGILTLGGPPKVAAANLPDLPDDVFGNTRPIPAVPQNAANVAAAPAAPPPAPTAPPATAPVAFAAAPGGGVVVMTRVVAGQAVTVSRRVGASRVVAGSVANATSAQPQQPGPPKPKVQKPLEEIESIHFERTPVMTARFMGQPNLDFTQPGRGAARDEPKKNEPKKDEPKKDAAKTADATARKGDVKKTDARPDEAKKTATPPKDEPKKTEGTDDVLAPPPGTAAPTKIAKLDPKPNGIRDLHLMLAGLRSAKIQQITVNCQTDKGQAAWRLNTSDSEDGPLVIRRSATEASADLFLEPPAGDCHQKDFTIMVNYEDGQAANATAKAGEHTSSTLAIDPKTPGVAWPDAWIYLTDDEKLFGKLEGIEPETLRLTTPWQDHLDVPLTRVIGIHIALLERKETSESFAKRLKARGSEDMLLAQTKKGEVIAIPGILEGTDRDKLRFRYQNRTRTLPLQQVEGLVLAARPESRQDEELRPTYALLGGSRISGRWKDLDSTTWKIETPWGQTLNLPAAEIEAVRLRGGKMAYLSDLKPGKVEETPFFGHRLSYRKDVNLLGEPLRMNGLAYEHGVAVHSRCVLTYDLGGRYSSFETLVGFDDAVKGRGRVDCRVVVDGKELYANPDLRADAPPVKLRLTVEGAEQLRLSIDFGRDQDTGDRVIWANARLYRPAGAKTANR